MREHDRKLLWGRSGNRCAMCNAPLVEGRSRVDREVLLAQEAHIISAQPNGPRHGPPPEGGYDAYPNRILLCATCHLVVDGQPDTYSVDYLRHLKQDHEARIARATGGGVVDELPNGPRFLINRDDELLQLESLLEEARTSPSPLVAVLSGMHGVGKSAVAAHWAQRNISEFANGGIGADLSRWRHRGAVDLDAVLATFLRLLGTDDESVPPTLDARRELFRRLTSRKRLVMVLDDVDLPAQVLTLMPAGAGSVVLVTTTFRDLDELFSLGASTHSAARAQRPTVSRPTCACCG